MTEEQLRQFAEQQARIGELLIRTLNVAIQNQQSMLSIAESSQEIKEVIDKAMIPYETKKKRKKKLMDILYANNPNETRQAVENANR